MGEIVKFDPSSNGSNGRDDKGRFVVGNPGGPSNPRAALARQTRDRLDEALHKACSPDRLLAAIDAVLKVAEAGDVAALRLLVERIAGPPIDRQLIERIEALEELLAERAGSRR